MSTPEDAIRRDGDPPIIVGGGGSTWVWIRKDQYPQPVDPRDLPGFPNPPDRETMPEHPELYNIWYLEQLTVQRVHVHDGQGGKPAVPINSGNKKKHRTYFAGTTDPPKRAAS